MKNQAPPREKTDGAREAPDLGRCDARSLVTAPFSLRSMQFFGSVLTRFSAAHRAGGKTPSPREKSDRRAQNHEKTAANTGPRKAP